MSKQVYLPLSKEVRIPEDLDRSGRYTRETTIRRQWPVDADTTHRLKHLGAPIPRARFKRSEVVFLVFIAVVLGAAYVAFLLWASGK